MPEGVENQGDDQDPVIDDAADDVADGYANPHPSGIDTATLSIPPDLAEWRYYEGSEKKQ